MSVSVFGHDDESGLFTWKPLDSLGFVFMASAVTVSKGPHIPSGQYPLGCPNLRFAQGATMYILIQFKTIG